MMSQETFLQMIHLQKHSRKRLNYDTEKCRKGPVGIRKSVMELSGSVG